MNRAELVDQLVAEHGLTKAGATRVLASVFDAIVRAVKKDDTASFPGFGTFKQVKRAARKGFNPATRESVKIPAARVPKFVPGAAFRDAVDAKAAARRAKKRSEAGGEATKPAPKAAPQAAAVKAKAGPAKAGAGARKRAAG